MANIRPRINKKTGKVISYEIRVYRGRDQDGVQLKPFTTTWTPAEGMTRKQTEKELQRFATLFEENCKLGNVATEKKGFSDYAGYVIELKERNGLKHSTAIRYRSLLERIKDVDVCGFGHLKLSDIRADTLNKFYAALSKPGTNQRTGEALSAKTIVEYHRFISAVLSQAVKEQLIPYNTAERATPPKVQKHEAEAFEVEEVTQIINAVENEPLKWRVLTHVFVATGARRGEILGLRWKDVDLKNNTLYLCNNLLYSKDKGIYNTTLKTGDSRLISVSAAVISMLKQWKSEQATELFRIGSKNVHSGYVFTQWDGSPMHPDSITDYFSKLSERYELPHINPHKFRHTQASLLINQGVDIVAVSKRLGHAKVSTTTDIYAHILQKADEKASDTISDLFYKQG